MYIHTHTHVYIYIYIYIYINIYIYIYKERRGSLQLGILFHACYSKIYLMIARNSRNMYQTINEYIMFQMLQMNERMNGDNLLFITSLYG